MAVIRNKGNYISNDRFGIITSYKIDEYKTAPISDNEDPTLNDKRCIGREIYVRKMERFYYKIRLYKMREW